MHVAELWRYPVKSMAGERLERAEIGIDGIAGDRIALIMRGDRVITSRTHSRLLAHHATIGSDGEPVVDGQPWNSPLVAQWVLDAAGEGARVVRYDGPERFDVLSLLVATDGAIDALGEDGRVMTTFHPDTLVQDVKVLRRIVREFDGSMALNCSVITPGAVQLGEAVDIFEP